MVDIWEISKEDIEIVQTFFEKYKNCNNAQKRLHENVLFPAPTISKELMWEVMFDCLLSSMQDSGRNSDITKFMETKPFPLNLTVCQSKENVGKFIQQTLLEHSCKRFINRIPAFAETNIKLFEGEKWVEFKKILSPLCEARTRPPVIDDRIEERRVAHWLKGSFKGLGTKQSRNYIQLLGLSRYEIPIDRRFVNWLIACNFPIFIEGKEIKKMNRDRLKTLLGVPDWYDMILDKIQELCIKTDIYPVILDGCVFGSGDAEECNLSINTK